MQTWNPCVRPLIPQLKKILNIKRLLNVAETKPKIAEWEQPIAETVEARCRSEKTDAINSDAFSQIPYKPF